MNDQAEEYVDRQKSKDDDYISYSLLKMVKKIPAKLAHTWTIRLSTVTAAHGLAGEPSSQSLGRGADDDSEDSDEDCDEDSDGPVEEAEQKGNQLEAGIVARIGGKRCCFIRPRALLYWLCVCVCVCVCVFVHQELLPRPSRSTRPQRHYGQTGHMVLQGESLCTSRERSESRTARWLLTARQRSKGQESGPAGF